MKKFLFIVILLSIFGCVESINENPNTLPEIEIFSPKANDTVHIGKNLVNYSAKDYFGGTGLEKFELILNGDLENIEEFKVKNNINPLISFNLPAELLGSVANYQIKVYNKEGKVTVSKKMENLYVGENKNAPEAPDTLELHRSSLSELILIWKDKSINEDGFEIFMKEGENGQYKPISTVGAGKTTYKATSLSPYILYFFKVKAFNKYGSSSFSNEVNSSQAGGNEPYDLKGEALGATVVQLNWRNMTFIYEAVKIQRKHATAMLWEDIETAIPETAQEYLDIKNLHPATSYNYRIAAKILGNWVYSNTIFVTTYDYDVAAPKNLRASFNIANNSIKIEWDKTLQESLIEEIIIERRDKFQTAYNKKFEYKNISTYKFEDIDIEQNKEYYYRARFLTSKKFFTPWSAETRVEVSEFAPNAPVITGISKITNTNNQYFLKWKDNSNNEDGFRVFIKQYGSADFVKYADVVANQTSLVITTPTTGGYRFMVKAYKGSIESAPSNEVTTGDAISSFQLTGSYSSITNEVKMSWTDLGIGVQVYKILRANIAAPNNWDYEVATLSTGTTTYNHKLPDTDKKQSFLYKIVAYFASEEKESNVITVSTY